ncbi:MAG: methionine--tRNA ligase, partial [Kiritimatiellae bacterium]|nr:methionine--tRNA ligase [Kiritimatiellia bacterium]
TPCERFFTEKDLQDGCCPECRREVEQIREANYFFRMSRRQDWLVKYIEDHPDFIQPSFRRNETLGFLRKPLNDLCISRPKKRLNWGIELPFDTDFVTYVWFDALVNYISAIGYLADEDQFTRWWPANYHLIGKDILTTHTVYWPTMLHAMGLPMPKTIFAHGWWLLGDSKMSKSIGNVVNPMEMADRYGVDAFRYFVMTEMSLGQDANFSEEAFVRRFNSDLANDLGNLLSRVLKMAHSYCGGVVPEAGAMDGPEEQELLSCVHQAASGMEEALDRMKIDQGVTGVLTAVRAVNRYLEQKQPWTLAKQEDKGPLHTTLYAALESLRVTAGLLQPVMPGKMQAIRLALGLDDGMPTFAELKEWGLLQAGTMLRKVPVLFPRIQKEEPPVILEKAGQVAKKNEGKKASSAAETPLGVITYDEFMKVQLRTACVTAAERVDGTDKLLKLQVDVGGIPRQLVAGIAQQYAPEQLLGKQIVIVANLKPAVIRGIESNGMLLAANDADGLKLITVDGAATSGVPVR